LILEKTRFGGFFYGHIEFSESPSMDIDGFPLSREALFNGECRSSICIFRRVPRSLGAVAATSLHTPSSTL